MRFKRKLNYYTPTNNNIFRIYLNDVGGYEILEREESLALIVEAQNGNIEARDLLLKSNQRFIISFCKRYSNGDDTLLMDLINEANIGLIEAINRFNINTKFTLLTYGVYWIERAINAYLTFTNPSIKIPNILKTAYIPEIKNAFQLGNGREPSDEEIVEILEEHFDIKIKNISDVYNLKINSIDSMYSGDSEDSLYSESLEFLSTLNSSDNDMTTYNTNDYEDEIDKNHLEVLLNDTISQLNERERKVIEMLYGINQEEVNVSTVAEELNMTPAGIRVIRERSLNKMRNIIGHER